jgi:hypothetical protein
MPPKDGASNSPPPVAPEKPLRFLAVGDTGKGNDGQRAVAKAMAETCRLRGCDFVVLLGDNFYESGASSPTDPIFKERFEDVYVGMPMPFWAVLGNHDYGARGLGSEFSKPDNQIAYASTSSRFKMPARYFHFVAGPVEFFALDTNAQMYKRDGQQKADVAAWIAASTAPWKISLGHHPYLSNGSHGNAGKYEDKSWLPVLSGGGVKSFAEQVVCGKVDIALSGHDHNQQWLEDTCDGTELIVSGAGAEGKEIASQRNAARYQSGELGFLYAEVTSKQFVAEFVNVNLQTEYGRVLTKR